MDLGLRALGSRLLDFFVPSQLPYNGPLTGERTEFHPLDAVANGLARVTTASSETQADVFASTDGRRAHAQETLNDRDYSFFVPAPPQPAPGARLTYRIVDHQGGTGPPEVVIQTTNGINMTIKYEGSSAPAYGKTFYVGWSKKTQADHVRVTVNSIKVNRSLDPNPQRQSQSGTPPGEYNLYLNANGDWKFINDWAPGLLTVTDGQAFTVNQGIDLYVQSGKNVRVYFTGRECDFVGIEPCPQTPEASDQNDRPGDITLTFPSVSAALGQHTAPSNMSTPSIHDPTVLPNYSITYTVSRVRG